MLADHRASFARAVAAEAAADDAQADDAPITKLTLMRALSAAIDDDTIVVNEYPMARDHVPRTTPGTWLQHSPAAGLGWGLPAALGVQHARPDATVVATLGDGAYLFANPAACHHAAALHQLPVVTVIATNRRWDAVAWSTLGLYPEGHAATAGNAMPLVSLDPVPDFVRYCEASGGWGIRVDTRAQLAPALAEAFGWPGSNAASASSMSAAPEPPSPAAHPGGSPPPAQQPLRGWAIENASHCLQQTQPPPPGGMGYRKTPAIASNRHHRRPEAWAIEKRQPLPPTDTNTAAPTCASGGCLD